MGIVANSALDNLRLILERCVVALNTPFYIGKFETSLYQFLMFGIILGLVLWVIVKIFS